MGIRISERTEIFHVPYGSLNSEGTAEASFVDVKADPAWIPVLPSCVGWPETQALLQVVNSPTSALMTLAADQACTTSVSAEHPVVLTSFVTLCRADVASNGKPAIFELAKFLKARMDDLLQNASTALQRSLYLDIVLEIQPTFFHHQEVEGWSLTVLMAAHGGDEGQARSIWRLGIQVLQDALTDHEA